MSYCPKRKDYVAVFGGDVHKRGGPQKLASIIGAWDEEHSESGMGSYSESYEDAVIRTLHAMGEQPHAALVLHGYEPDIAAASATSSKPSAHGGCRRQRHRSR